MLRINEPLPETSWSSTEIDTALKKCNCIKYAAYRTASKLRVIQKAFLMDKVQLQMISGVFEKHQLRQTENSVHLDRKELESVLSDIYYTVKTENFTMSEVDYVSHLMIDFLLNVYDMKMKIAIEVLSFKVGLTLLCHAKPREKYHYLFEQMADHNYCLSRRKLEVLLKKMICITEYLGEGLSFGFQLIQGTVESCFQCNIGSLGISEDFFITWLMQDPQLLVWLSTMYRMQISESVSHNAKCGICKANPLIGLRFRCLRCLSFDMCQSCFFMGKLSKKHKLKHPVQEYCHPMTSQQCTKAFLLTLRNRLYRKDSKLQYLPAIRVDSSETESLGQSTRLLDELQVSSRTVIFGSRVSLHAFPYTELQNIILQLEKESEKIISQIDNLCSGLDNSAATEYRRHLRNCLLMHKDQVKNQVRKLKLFRNYLGSCRKFDPKGFLASTPVVDGLLSKTEKRVLSRDLVNLSPITGCERKKKEGQGSTKKMMWDNFDLVRRDLDNGSCDGVNPSWEEIKSEKRECNVLQVCRGSSEEKFIEVEDRDLMSTLSLRKPLPEFENSSRMRLTWLQESPEGSQREEGNNLEEKEETYQELQSHLCRILDKLQDLSVVTLKEDEGDTCGRSEGQMEMAAEVDTLLVDLIKGIEKLIGHEIWKPFSGKNAVIEFRSLSTEENSRVIRKAIV